MGMQTLDATSMLLQLLLWSNLVNQIFAAEDESHISTPQNQSLVLHNSKNFSAFVGGDTFEGENSLELLNDSYSSDEVVTSSREFSDNLKDILRVDEEDEEGSAIAMQDSEHNSYDNYGYSEEENYISEKESDLNDEGDQKRESDFDMTTRSPAFESGENVSTSEEVNVLTTERELSEETTETSTNGSLIIKQEESLEETTLVKTTLVEESLVETSLVEESLVECFYVAPSSTFASLPDSISCSCAGAASTFKWSCLLPEALTSLSSVLLTNCSTLQLDLRASPSTPSSLPSIKVQDNVEEVHLLLPSLPLSHLSLTIDGSPRVEVTVAKQEEINEDLKPLVLGLGALSLLLLALVLLLLLCLHKHRREVNGDTKKVSRAESWRYESSIYVQAPGGARPKPVYVAPPLPPPGLATPPTPHATWSRDNTAPESGSSSPLLRAGAGGQYSAYSGVRGVDVVRTSLTARQEPTPTPPGPRQSRHRGRKGPTPRQEDSLTDSGSDSESRRQHHVSTLPTR